MSRFLVIAVGLALCLLLTLALFGLPLGPSLSLLAQGAFADKFALSRTLVKATPLLLTSLGVVLAWRAGMYNIGGEGQFIVGGLFSAALAKWLVFGAGFGGPLALLLLLVFGALGGAGYGLLAGWLYTKRGVDVVIGTILLNFVALQLLGWAVSHPLQEKAHALPQTDLLPASTMLWRPDRQMDLHLGVALAILMAFGIQFLLFRTAFGYRLRLVGANPRVAQVNKVPTGAVQASAMALSGALCGLAGAVEYTSIAGQLGTSSSQNWGFLAIPVALLGGLSPLGAILSAIYFGALFAGSEQLGRFTSGGSTLVYVIQAVAVLAYAWSSKVAEERRFAGALRD